MVQDPGAVIRGESLSLRAARPVDAQRWFELLTDPVQLRFGTPAFMSPPSSPGAVAERVDESRRHWADGTPGTLVIVESSHPRRFLGHVAWRYDVHPLLGIADVGYAVHPDARGRGVARAALELMVRWMLHDEEGPGLARVQLDHSVENPASCRVALAAGLEREGVRRGFLPLREPAAADDDGSPRVRRHDVCLHGVVAGI